MAQFEDFTAALDKLDSGIVALEAKLGTPTGTLSADQEAALIARLTAAEAKLALLAAPAAVA